ncbi:response regulator [Chitinimonas sp. BJYL2]|uniref:response regulator n=1 Tax=Chitinimonas sp. BJYL2 TaxID=2976696 RepID=UPI0022B35BE9|nr:response regulator [Chitinimonas sp. BJYL2]
MSQRQPSALIADPSSSVRLSLRGVLQGMDFGRIDTATSVSEARRRLQESKYDLVLCEFHFETDDTGQDLLEECRERKILPLSTLFFMVTGEAAYANVVNVAEETPDDYMLKPIQAGELSARIERAFNRRQALMEIYEALNAKQYNAALKSAQQMMQTKTPYLGDIVKLAANIFMRLGRLEESASMYKRILEARNPAWAKLGLARVAIKQGDHETAEAAMLDIINQHSRYLPVYNQLVDLYRSEERYADALGIIEQAIKITPNNLKRLQSAGQMAHSIGDMDKANSYLLKALRVNGKAVDLDDRTIFQLIMGQIDQGQMGEASSLVKQLSSKPRRDDKPDRAHRGEWYTLLAAAAEAIARREPLAAIDMMREVGSHAAAPEFDFDLALDYFTVLNRLYAEDIAANMIEWIKPIAERFDTGRAAEELLLRPIADRAKLAEVVVRAGEQVAQITNRAAQLVVANNFRAAADELIREGERTRNNRLLAAAVNAAAKAYLAYKEDVFRTQAEHCLVLMAPPDPMLAERMRKMLEGTGDGAPAVASGANA